MYDTMTQKQAIAVADSGLWKDLTSEQILRFQLYQERLCMPFDVFHKAVEKTLGRPVFSHEFATPELLRKEYEAKNDAPTHGELLELLEGRNISWMKTSEKITAEKEKGSDKGS